MIRSFRCSFALLGALVAHAVALPAAAQTPLPENCFRGPGGSIGCLVDPTLWPVDPYPGPDPGVTDSFGAGAPADVPEPATLLLLAPLALLARRLRRPT